MLKLLRMPHKRPTYVAPLSCLAWMARKAPEHLRKGQGPNNNLALVAAGGGQNRRKKNAPARVAVPQPSQTQTKKRRYRPGTLALKEIRKYQKSVEFLIRKLPFQRLVREIADSLVQGSSFRWEANALTALQEAAEMYVVHALEVGIHRYIFRYIF